MSARTTCAVPSVGCPANGISKVGVKMRTRAVAAADCGRRMKVVSERLNCRAIACMVAVSRLLPSSKTQSGLPARRDSANTLTMR